MLDEPLTFPQISPQTVTDLETVLAAWQDATTRLEQTHVALREEVRRLTDELEAKNRELARKNRLADLGQMASHVAHEVRNNLVPVTLYLSLLRRRISGDRESLSILDKIRAENVDCNVSVKLSQLGLGLDTELAYRNLVQIVQRARDQGNFVRVDMEGSPYTQRTLDLVRELPETMKPRTIPIETKSDKPRVIDSKAA